jgi:2-dehydro-3-deoxygalactonokinase
MPACLAVDWGTTHRRLFQIDAAGGLVARDSDNRGILAVGDFTTEIAALVARAGGAPLLLAGMIGSNRGWVEAPYVPAPAGIDALAAAIVEPLPGVFIVPGVRFDDPAHPDIMRGEEVQCFGARALGLIGDGLACFPGTHSKWIEIEDGGIARFRTIMTGDILAALKARSILSDLLDHEPGIDAAFVDGVDHALDTPDLTADLFTVRARVVTGALAAADAASHISGLLIGTDVRIGLGRLRADVVPVIGTPALTARFALALNRAGRETIVVDGESAFMAGAAALATRLPGTTA